MKFSIFTYKNRKVIFMSIDQIFMRFHFLISQKTHSELRSIFVISYLPIIGYLTKKFSKSRMVFKSWISFFQLPTPLFAFLSVVQQDKNNTYQFFPQVHISKTYHLFFQLVGLCKKFTKYSLGLLAFRKFLSSVLTIGVDISNLTYSIESPIIE